jgi:hypothetical protein
MTNANVAAVFIFCLVILGVLVCFRGLGRHVAVSVGGWGRGSLGRQIASNLIGGRGRVIPGGSGLLFGAIAAAAVVSGGEDNTDGGSVLGDGGSGDSGGGGGGGG